MTNTLLSLETPRLSLRKFEPSDASFLVKLMNDPDWIRFIGDRNIHSEADAIAHINEIPIPMYAEYQFGMLMVIRKDTQNIIGVAGILKRDFLEHPDLGYAFLPEGRGRGFALEAAQHLMETAKSQLSSNSTHENCVQAIVNPDNTASIALLKKLGFVFIADKLEGSHLPTHIYECNYADMT